MTNPSTTREALIADAIGEAAKLVRQVEALAPALIWQDRRADCALPLSEARVQELTGQLVDPSHLAPKARWLLRHLAASGAERPARFHQPVSFLVERLTGRAVMDPALASTSLLFALAEQH